MIQDVQGARDEQIERIGNARPDPPGDLVKFRTKYNLPFILLSDPDHKIAEAYGAWGEKKMLAEFKLKVKPEKTADLALRLIQL